MHVCVASWPQISIVRARQNNEWVNSVVATLVEGERAWSVRRGGKEEWGVCGWALWNSRVKVEREIDQGVFHVSVEPSATPFHLYTPQHDCPPSFQLSTESHQSNSAPLFSSLLPPLFCSLSPLLSALFLFPLIFSPCRIYWFNSFLFSLRLCLFSSQRLSPSPSQCIPWNS